MRRLLPVPIGIAVLAGLMPLLPATPPAAAADGVVMAGVAKVDSTWHVGASAGQYASERIGEDGVTLDVHSFDPHAQSIRRQPSYGIQGREWVHSLVVEGIDGTRFAIITNDLYIPQDLVNRRVGTILAEHDAAHPEAPTGITPENMTISVSHSHSSPYYSTPSWGVWAFQDVFDIRFFEHIAQKMADAVIEASSSMVPVRMGAGVSRFTLLKRHSFGTEVADDGSPAGYPSTDVDPDLTVVRFDDISNPSSPQPLASWVVFGLHPEMMDGNDLLASEWVNTMYRIVDREIGGTTLLSQRDLGTSEPARNAEAHPPHLRQEFSHREYAQAERAARTLADAVEATWRDVAIVSAGGQARVAHTVEPFDTDFVVDMKDLRFAPPSFRLFPTVSNCRTKKTFNGNPGIPIVGLPDCGYFLGPVESGFDQAPIDPGVTYDALIEAGVPVPDNVGAPSYTGLQETLQVHLQAIRLGDLGITVCPCEQWADQSRNIRTRLDHTPGNLWYGWDWTANYTDPAWQPGVIYDGKPLPGHGPITLNDWCVPNGANWDCRNPNNPAQRITITEDEFLHMKAQIYNDARGWDLPENSLRAESEPADPDDVWGNYTHEELTEFAYDIVIPVSMSNDYWGYIATYREFQRGDHYRKALTGLGPHSSDFLATRLSRMAAELNGGPPVTLGPKDLAYQWDYVHQGLRAQALGEAVQAYLPLYEQTLPADGGAPAITTQPQSIERFGAAKVSWIGGSNYVDTPRVTVERCVGAGCDEPGDWQTYAEDFGEVEVKVTYPEFPQETVAWRLGQHQWRWDATFEAFDSDIPLPDAQAVRRTQTPVGTYRFVIEGCHRSGQTGQPIDPACPSHELANRVAPYRLTSSPFAVSRWTGITVPDIRVEPDGTVSFTIGPPYLGPDGAPLPISASNTERGPIDYPNTYASPFRFIQPRTPDDVRNYGGGAIEAFCFHCSFRPWADTGAVRSARVTIISATGKKSTVSAAFDPTLGRWRTSYALGPGERALVARAGVVDEFDEFNGQASATVTA
jgi:hypothetical protein